MMRLQRQVLDVIAKDPDVASWGSAIGGARAQNTGLVVITLKPRDRRAASADQVIARLRPQLAAIKGIALFMQAAQDLNVGGRLARTQYQYTLEDADLDELNAWAPKILAKLKTLPDLRDVATDQQTGGGTLTLTIDRDQAARFGIQPQQIDQVLDDAFGQRQVAQYSPSAAAITSYWRSIPRCRATRRRSTGSTSPRR
jgi:multidrug efflux pump subunit AcrB